jgi:hypothetical protein
VETDFDAKNGILHGVVTDIASGITLSDTMVFLQDPKYGTYDPKVDGVFSAELYIDGEHPLTHSTDPSLTRPGLAVIDNIDTINRHPGNAYDFGHDHGSNTKWDGICSDHHGSYEAPWTNLGVTMVDRPSRLRGATGR